MLQTKYLKSAVATGVMVMCALAGQAAMASTVVTKSFTELGTPSAPLKLTTTQASYTVKVPAAAREVVTGATLHLETVNSTALVKSRSELTVRINDKVIAQYPLDPDNTKTVKDIKLPADMLVVGYNNLSVGVIQHYTYDCEDAGNPELWTEIDPQHSTVTFDIAGQKANDSPKVSQLDLAFDKRGWLPKKLAVIVGTEQVTPAQLQAASYVVQGLALRMGYRPLDIEVHASHAALANVPHAGVFPNLNTGLLEGKDVLIIGKASDISNYIDGATHKAITTPKKDSLGLSTSTAFVGTFAENKGDSVIMVVSGDSDKEVIKAARSVADPGYKYTESSMAEAITKDPVLPESYTARIREDETFGAFGYRTTFARGLKLQPIDFEFKAPADYGAKNGDKATVALHMSYGAGLRKESSMAVYLNGHFATSVALNEPNGGEYNNFEIKLPAEYIQPGFNRVSFVPVFLAHKDRCEMFRDEHLLLTVFEDSTINIPRATVAAKVPDLQRTAQGFWPHDSHAQIYATSQDPGTAAATLGLTAMLAQKNKAPIDVTVQNSMFSSGATLIVGPYGSIKGKEIEKNLPLMKYNWNAKNNQAGLFQFNMDNRPVTAFLATDADVLNKAVYSLNEKGLWASLRGEAAVIDTDNHIVSVEDPKPEAVKGYGNVEKTASKYGLNKSTYQLYGVIGGVVIASIALMGILAGRSKRRQRSTQDTTIMDDDR